MPGKIACRMLGEAIQKRHVDTRDGAQDVVRTNRGCVLDILPGHHRDTHGHIGQRPFGSRSGHDDGFDVQLFRFLRWLGTD